MKRNITLILFAVLVAAAAHAQTLTDGIRIHNLDVNQNDGSVRVSFTAVVAPGSVASDYTMVFAPVLTDGTYRVSMPPVVVQGKRARRSLQRYEWVSDDRFAYPGAVHAPMGADTEYTAAVDAQRWMNGANLVFESVLGGCCSYQSLPARTLAENIAVRVDLPAPEPASAALAEATEPAAIPAVVSAAVPVFVPETLADTLSIRFPFVESVAVFDPQNPFRIYDDERDNALIIYFDAGSSRINSGFRGNAQILRNLTQAVQMIMNDPKSDVETIVIGGFSSPDGNYEINDRLAFQRAESVKAYIVRTTGIDPRTVLTYNGSVDWRGLRYMVSKSNLLERDQIIDIIDTVPVWDARNQRGRHGELMRLNGGTTYRYLKSEYFPLMRNGAFIKVYYKNK